MTIVVEEKIRRTQKRMKAVLVYMIMSTWELSRLCISAQMLEHHKLYYAMKRRRTYYYGTLVQMISFFDDINPSFGSVGRLPPNFHFTKKKEAIPTQR